MTTTENTPEQPTEAETIENPTAGQEPEDKPVEGNTANREAAKYRKQLREAEAARDAALELVEPARRALLAAALRNIEHITVTETPNSTTNMHHGHLRPEALDDAGIDVAAMFDGMTVNEDRVREELKRVYEAKPYLFAAPPMIVPNEGRGYGGTYTPGFEAAFSPDNRR